MALAPIVEHLDFLSGVGRVASAVLGRAYSGEGTDNRSVPYALSVLSEAGELASGVYEESRWGRAHNAIRLARHLIELDVQADYLLSDWQSRKFRLYKEVFNSWNRKPRLMPLELFAWVGEAAGNARAMPSVKQMIDDLSRDDYSQYRMFSTFAHPGWANFAFTIDDQHDPMKARTGRAQADDLVRLSLLRMALTSTAGSCLSILGAVCRPLGISEWTRDENIAAFGFDVREEIEGAKAMLDLLITQDAAYMDAVTDAAEREVGGTEDEVSL